MTIEQQQMEEGRINIDVQAIFKEPTQQSQSEEQEYSRELSQPSQLHQPISIELLDIKNHSPSKLLKFNPTVHSPISAQVQLQNLTKLIKEKEVIIKKLKSFDTVKQSTRLSQQKQSVCSKCHKKETSHHVCKESPPKQTKTGHKRSLFKSDVHDRLYNMSKSQILKQMYMPEQAEKPEKKTHRKSASSLSANKYLKNYTPFEKRLQEYLNRQQYTANQSLLKSQTEFRPQLIPNKYNDRVSSRYRESHLKDSKAIDFADFMNSSVSSSRVSASSQSAQLALRIQEHFLRKMKLIFVKNPHQKVSVSEAVIGLLTDVEFSVLQPFIMQIEETPIKGEDFQANFRFFYDSLSPADKMQLRNHELKTKVKYREIKQDLKRQKSSKVQLFKVEEKPYAKNFIKPISKRQTKRDSSYHLVIQNFI